ncbi:PLDc_N domain-containing protein [bacterium]|jgi:hypothetical protein|nr:PLDc_N domain-containing protein [bacterium]MBT3903958.1 PLDc_N domain-containing protein [bacterium]MBT4577740.1 PLDc_N domain-containing protein [bacterium]MBT5346063.1 PLDc_N domain-containing protein [bacterium]MBT6131311.1 PLDc_N domain-containing protein [bacterium]
MLSLMTHALKSGFMGNNSPMLPAAGFTVLFALALGLSLFWLFMLIDLIKQDHKDKLFWLALLLFSHMLGAILYYVYVKKQNDNKPNLDRR